MGKSPGKWIKNVLFGKKHSKSRPSKSVTTDKRVSLRTTEDQVENSQDVLTENGAPYMRLENGKTLAISNTTSSNGIQRPESPLVSVPLSDDEILKQNQSAAILQAAFRGYLARRAFNALKGIIRLQALIRGHLVRRQAVATLYYTQAIVKLQAAVRGRSTTEKRLQNYDLNELKVNLRGKSVLNYEKVASNSYIRKLLSSVPNSMPLNLEFEETEPNSASAWLDRWTNSHFWGPVQPKKVSSVKNHRNVSSQIVENNFVKSRRTSRRGDNTQNGDNGVSGSRLKRNPKNELNHQSEFVQEPHQNELERVKRSLRKISSSPTEKIETVSENPTLNPDSLPEVKAFEIVTDPADDLPRIDTDSLENGNESKREETEEMNVINENEKVRDLRSEFNENTPQRLPSYMTVTASAKAKLRASGSPKHGEFTVTHIRRHSLPNSANGKVIQRTNKLNGSIREGWKR